MEAGCTKGLILQTYIEVIFMNQVLLVFFRLLREVIGSCDFLLWLGWLGWLEHRPVHWKVMGLIPSQGTFLGCRFDPQ